VQIWDLVGAFNKVMASIGAGAATHDVVFDDTPISLHAADLVDRLDREGGRMRFEQIFAGRNRAEMIGLFLALLELMRQMRVRVAQDLTFDAIDIELLSREPIQVGAEWGDAFAEAVLGDDAEQESTHDAVESLATGDHVDRDALPEGTHPSESPTGDLNDATPSMDDHDDDEAFAELDRIKTDVDVDAILRKGRSDGGDIKNAGADS